MASGNREGIKVFKERFKTFLRALESAEYAGDYLDLMRAKDQLGELLSTYEEFWDASKLVRQATLIGYKRKKDCVRNVMALA